ncbi:uncharacterized protein LOC127810306 isoform X2 [Diospyros lotus]|uniref:uncharacterized protein LOC127810306 isoform X2 n=1 Tax=Diospyros lotus TaxID=55363 RepID=UPI002256C1D1|nr:uncharacterized protein LOC127810306 isoform X2 [Diospyros lotus]
MPPSPALRCSPGTELRGDNHLLMREKDDDLTLFKEMQTRESDYFLLQSNDEFEDMFSTKLRYFSDCNLGLSIPARGESSDLLNADGEKNDYEWLLTPPDTPLFPSLNDETSPVSVPQRGRPRSQPIAISRSSTMDKSNRSSRGSASPNRLSPSPRSGKSTFQMRGRPSSAPHSGPPPNLHCATPSQRSSPPPSKPSPPAPRSSTPTPKRTSVGSGGTMSSSGARGTSPLNKSRGNSASPKVRSWQTNLPGYSSDASVNLRISLADRPASYLRDPSPVSRTRRDSSYKSGRQSMPPTASRSVSSSHSQDLLSSHSKGSVTSSGDDDLDSLQSIPMISSDCSASRRVGSFPMNRAAAFSKKPIRTGLSSSAPKRSFDSALRQMGQKKGSQYMFRPLLSSVPSSTFYVGKASAAANCALTSGTSLVPTSSNAGFDHGTTGAHDAEGNNQNQDDMAGECGNIAYPENQATSPAVHDGPSDVQHGDSREGAGVDFQLDGFENFYYHSMESSEVLQIKGMTLCSRCGCNYDAMGSTEEDLKLCPDCRRSDEPLSAISPVPTIIISDNFPSQSVRILKKRMSFDAMEPLIAMPGSSEVISKTTATPCEENVHGSQTSLSKHMSFDAMEPLIAMPGSSEVIAKTTATPCEENVHGSRTSCAKLGLSVSSENFLARKLEEEEVCSLANQQVIGQPTVGYNTSDGADVTQQIQSSSSTLDFSEGAGISVLLKRSNSGNGPVVRGRTFNATSIAYGDPFYVRDGTSSIRNSLGKGSLSASTSLDLGLARQTESHVQKQLSGSKSNVETCRCKIDTKHQRTGSSLSGNLNHASQSLGLVTNMHEESFEAAVNPVENEAIGVTDITLLEQLSASESAGLDGTCVEVVCNNQCGTMFPAMSELSTNNVNINAGESAVASFSNIVNSASYADGEAFQNDRSSISNQEESAFTLEASKRVEDSMPNSFVDRVDFAEVPSQIPLETVSELEIENGHLGLPGYESVGSPNSKSTVEESPESSVAVTSDKDVKTSVSDPDTLDHAHGILVDGHVGPEVRSLTLEEATDAILFCSSIIHNLAYEAATTAIEKENSVPLEVSRPMVTILGNSHSDRKNPQERAAAKRASKARWARQMPEETDPKPPPSGNAKADASTTRMVGVRDGNESLKPPQKLESKCNCTVM